MPRSIEVTPLFRQEAGDSEVLARRRKLLETAQTADGTLHRLPWSKDGKIISPETRESTTQSKKI